MSTTEIDQFSGVTVGSGAAPVVRDHFLDETRDVEGGGPGFLDGAGGAGEIAVNVVDVAVGIGLDDRVELVDITGDREHARGRNGRADSDLVDEEVRPSIDRDRGDDVLGPHTEVGRPVVGNDGLSRKAVGVACRIDGSRVDRIVLRVGRLGRPGGGIRVLGHRCDPGGSA